MTHLDEIKSRISIEELVGGYVQLKKAGRNFKGLCPFHSEKTPSFVVSPEKEIAYCFGCHKGGDIFKFTQIVESVEFGEAVRMLADKANVTLPKAPAREHNKRLKAIEANEAAVEFFMQNLGDEHRKYFIERGLNEASMKSFKLGYAPDSFDALKSALKAKDFSEPDLAEAGLLNQKSMADKNTYDRFRNRLIFPIADHQGNTVGFGGRALDDQEPKYLNSPDTPAYNKSTVLYGLNLAKDSIKEKDLVIFVEGYMDVISSYQVGVKNVVAASGTALTPQQLKLIKRYTKNVAFAFDADSAGMEATLRGIELAQLAGMNITIVDIPEGKDPDECIQKSAEGWQKAAEAPVTVMDFYFKYAASLYDKSTIEGKKGYMNILLPVIKLYESEVEQGIYLNRLAVEIQTDVKLLWNDLKKAKPLNIQPKNNQPQEDPIQQKSYSRETFLLGLMLAYPNTYKYVHNSLIENLNEKSALERFYKACQTVYTEESVLDINKVKNELEEEDKEKIEILKLLIDEHYPDFPDEMAEKEVQKLVRDINQKRLKARQKECEIKLRSATTSGEKKLLLNQYNEILKLTMKLK